MCAHYLIDADFCNVASGWEKGVVEKNVQDSRRRIWIDAAQQRFGSFVELNAWLGDRCRALWEEVAVFVDQLPPKQRVALTLRKYHELGYAEIADALRCSEAAARASVHEALRKLRDCFGDRI